MMNLWSSQQQVIWSVSVKNIARYLRSQVPDLAFEFDLSHRARTIVIEAIDGTLGGVQSMSEDSQELHDPKGHDAQHGSWIHLNTVTSDDPMYPVKYMVLSFSLDMYVVGSEGYAGDMLRGMKAIFFIYLLWFSRNPGHEGLSIV